MWELIMSPDKSAPEGFWPTLLVGYFNDNRCMIQQRKLRLGYTTKLCHFASGCRTLGPTMILFLHAAWEWEIKHICRFAKFTLLAVEGSPLSMLRSWGWGFLVFLAWEDILVRILGSASEFELLDHCSHGSWCLLRRLLGISWLHGIYVSLSRWLHDVSIL